MGAQQLGENLSKIKGLKMLNLSIQNNKITKDCIGSLFQNLATIPNINLLFIDLDGHNFGVEGAEILANAIT